MKKFFWAGLAFALLTGGISAWMVFGPLVKAPKGNFFYVKTGSDYQSVKDSLLAGKIIPSGFYFNLLAIAGNYRSHIKPGKYEIKEGGSMLDLFRSLRSGSQSPVRLIINKLRTRKDLAAKLGRNFEADSADIMQFLSNNDSLARLGKDTHTVMTIVIPNSYLLYWNTPYYRVLRFLKTQSEMFWTNKRKQQLERLGIDAGQAYILASIVEEETLKDDEKGLIASVYLNRIRKGMKLQADPTVKFAIGDFSIRRIMFGHLQTPSPYNTYMNAGLPPGPICTPSINTIDAVLEAPTTKYLYFAARSDFKGYHAFAETYGEHLANANLYRKALDSLTAARNAAKSK